MYRTVSRLWVRVAVMALACGAQARYAHHALAGASGAAGAKVGAVGWERGELAVSGGAGEDGDAMAGGGGGRASDGGSMSVLRGGAGGGAAAPSWNQSRLVGCCWGRASLTWATNCWY